MAKFQTTRWSLVLAASDQSQERRRDALAGLFESYWFPIYAFARGQGYSEEDASDLVQGYFAGLIEGEKLRGLEPAAGRFRSFVIVSARNFFNNERERIAAQKRGGGKALESLDSMAAERRLANEPVSPADAEFAFERRWAETVVARARKRLRDELIEAGHEDRFELLGGLLSSSGVTHGYREIAERLNLTEAGVKSLAHRLRKRFGVLLRGEVLQTVDRAEEVEDEIRYLLAVLSRN